MKQVDVRFLLEDDVDEQDFLTNVAYSVLAHGTIHDDGFGNLTVDKSTICSYVDWEAMSSDEWELVNKFSRTGSIE